MQFLSSSNSRQHYHHIPQSSSPPSLPPPILSVSSSSSSCGSFMHWCEPVSERERERGNADRYRVSSGEAVEVELAESDSQSFPSPSLVCRPAPWQPQTRPRWKVSGAAGSARVMWVCVEEARVWWMQEQAEWIGCISMSWDWFIGAADFF